MADTSGLYSQLKVAAHPDRIADLRAGKRPVPVHVQLILSDLCNQDCSFCAYRISSGLSSELFATGELAATGHNNPIRAIPTEKALEIVEDCAYMGVKAIQFTGGGEPTVHADHLKIIGLAQELGMDTALVTNGVRLDPDHPAIHGLTWIRVSIDAGTPDAYTDVRRVPMSHWVKVWSNVQKLAPQYTGTLGIGFVVTPQNYHTAYEAAKMAKRAGAANIRLGAVFTADGTDYYPKELLPQIHAELERVEELADGTFEVANLFTRRLGNLAAGRPTEEDCGYQYMTVYIGGDLNVYRCCNTAYTRAGTVGSLKDQRFRDALLAYEPFDARTCRYCQFLAQNTVINTMVKEPTLRGVTRTAIPVPRPKHANFV